MHSLAFQWPTRNARPPLALLATLLVPVALLLTAPQIEIDLALLLRAGSTLPAFLGNFLVVPDWGYLPELGRKLLETLQITLLASSIALVVSLPLGILAANNATPHPLVGQTLRALLAMVRALPDLVWALVFVSALGLGPLPGVLALAVVTIGLLAKFFAESIEVVDPRPIEGVRASGANWLQVRLFAMLPQAVPDIIGTTLYIIDHNIRAAAILGLVGAGGIGYDMITAMRLFAYDRLILIMLAIYLAVTLLDRASGLIRRTVI